MNIVFVNKFTDVADILKLIGTDSKTSSIDTGRFLVLMDVDETMITMKDKILRPAAANAKKQMFNEIFQPLTDKSKQLKFSKYIKQTDIVLMDESVPDVVKELQNRGMIVLGFTRMMPGAGKCGEIESMEDNRRDELLKFDIDLRNKFLPDQFVIDLPEKDGRVPFYKDGIIYSLPYTKGEVIKRLLTYHFKHLDIEYLCFVDDAKHHIVDVAEVCVILGINHICVHYVDAEIGREKFDEDFGAFQFRYFNKTDVWLNDSHYGDYIMGHLIF